MSDRFDINHVYDILGLKAGVSVDEVKQAYRQMAKTWHPDCFLKNARELELKQKKAPPKPATPPPSPESQSQPSPWQCVHTLTHLNWVFTTAISPDGQTLVSGSSDNTIKIWHLNTGKLLHTLTGHTKWVRCLAFSPDSQTLVSGSDDSSIMI